LSIFDKNQYKYDASVMKNIRSVRENIETLHRSNNHLASFVVQATYFESLIRAYSEARLKTFIGNSGSDNKIAETISDELAKAQMHSLLKTLCSCGWIEEKIKNELTEYFEFRNKVMHRLARQVRNREFIDDLKTFFVHGKKLINLPIFSNTDAILAASDDKRFVFGHGKILNISGITEQQIREVLEMTLSGKTITEISDETTISEASVRSITHNKLAIQIEFRINLKGVKRANDSLKKKRVLSEIGKILNISEEEILSKSRKANISFARHVSMYILNKELNLSFPRTASALGRTDHTTAISAVKRIQGLIKSGRVKILLDK
jgi:hypothetical protein